MKRKRKEKPLLQVLLIAALALNTTLSFVVLANRDRMVGQSEKTKRLPPIAEAGTTEGTTVEAKAQTVPQTPSEPDPTANSKRAEAPKAAGRKNYPAKVERALREKDEITFFPSPILYRLTRDTILVTRSNGARIVIPRGTKVRVAGITRDDKALVVSRKGNPDGLIARATLEAIPDEQVIPDSSAPLQRRTVNAPSRAAEIPGSFRLSGGPYGGSIGLGGAQIFVGQNGQVSGSLSR